MINKKNIQNIYELTPMQGVMLFNDLYSDEAIFHEQISYNINTELDIDLFQKAWESVVRRHDILRTNFIHKNVDEPIQIVLKQRDLNFLYEDISDRKNQEEEIINYKKEDKKKRFDLSKDNLLKIAVFKKNERSYRVVISFHHIIMDGWCSIILYEEFKELYFGLLDSKIPKLPQTTPYVKYVKYLRNFDPKAQEKFWSDYLDGYKALASLPNKKSSSESSMQEFHFHFSDELTARLYDVAKSQKVTLNTLVQTLWAILLSKYNDTKDVVFGSIVSGRPPQIEHIETMIGLFMNTIAVRIKYDSETTISELLADVQENMISFDNNAYYPLAKIQAQTPLKNNLLDHSFVFENYPSTEEENRLHVSDFSMDDYSGENFTIQAAPGDSLHFKLMYNEKVFDTKTIEAIEDDLTTVAGEVVENPNMEVLKVAEYIAKKYKKDRSKIVVTATFTTENISNNLEWWAREFDMLLDITFSGYNQVFQELLNENSSTSQNNDVNIMLIRFEDFVRSQAFDENQMIDFIEPTYKKLLEILHNKEMRGTYFFGIFPVSTHLGLSEKLRIFIDALNDRFLEDIKGLTNSFGIDFRTLERVYQVDSIFDPIKDQAGHLPFSDEFYIAFSTEVFRNIYALKKEHFKVIALDCDNTLWSGIVGEDGHSGIIIDEGYRDFQKFLVKKYQEGFLLVLNSKNNENDVWEVFEKNSDMILQKEHIVAHKINWQAKSQNLKELALELNVGLNSFVFFDDNGVECSEVMQNAPEVFAIQVPKNSSYLENFMSHVWAVDKLKITEEDTKRTKMYKADQERQNILKATPSMDEFLSSLSLKIDMHAMGQEELPRVAQLTQRTNQFNMSTIRRSEQEISLLDAHEAYSIWSVYVSDKYGDYGLVAVIITKDDLEKSELFIDTFLMSCRVLGRGVEQSILHGLKKYAQAKKITTLRMEYIPTKKNIPALTFIEESGWTFVEENADKKIFSYKVVDLPQRVEYVELDFNKKTFTQKPQLSVTIQAPQEVVHHKKIQENVTWTITLENSTNLLHLKYYLPLQYFRAKDIDTQIQSVQHRNKSSDYVAPSNLNETKITHIFEEILQLDNISVEDDFFQLGGQSLSATILLSRINRAFNKDISLKEIFYNPSVKALASLVETSEQENGFSSIEKIEEASSYELTGGQQRLWLLSKFEGAALAYNMPMAFTLEGKFNTLALERSLNILNQEYEILRTYFVLEDGVPKQKIAQDLVSSLDMKEAHKEDLDNLILHELQEPFDLTQLPLYRLKLFSLGSDKTLLLFTMHHIISDGWSLSVFMSKLNHLYNAFVNAKEVESISPEIQYKDYSFWQNSFLQSAKAKQMQEFWLKKLEGFQSLDFPTDYPRPTEQSFKGKTLSLEFDESTTQLIKELALGKNMSLFMFINAAVKLLLYKYSDQNDITIGSVVSNRSDQTADQIGFFVNTIVLRDVIDENASLDNFFEKIKLNTLEALDNQYYPFDKLVEDLSAAKMLKKDMSRSPIFDILLVLQNYQDTDFNLSGLSVESFESNFSSAQFDLTFTFTEYEQKLGLNLNYNVALFDTQHMDMLLQRLQIIVQDMLSSPSKMVRDINYISPDEKERLLHRLKKEPKLPSTSLVKLFQLQVEKSPNNIALIYKDSQLSYAELNKQANRAANYLQVQCHLKRGDKVALLLHNYNAVVATIALLKLGVTYIPIDKKYPRERIEYILENSGVKTLLYQNDFSSLVAEIDADLIEFSRMQENTDEYFALESVSEMDLLYIIYTSGTTGKPKGVMIKQNSFINLLEWYIDTFEIDESQRVLLMIPFVFDASMKNIFAPLVTGATVVLSDDNHYNPQEILSLIEKQSVTLVNCVPSAFKPILDIAKKEEYRQLQTMKNLALGGETLSLELFGEWIKQSEASLYNIYGPTEATDISTFKKIDFSQKRVSIGRSIPNTKIYILDKHLNVVPYGKSGEMYISGHGVAEGYVNNKLLSDQAFISNPYKLDERLYKSGDRAQYLPNGDIEFLGRVDSQIKIRGNRVELQECENNLLTHDFIMQSVVVVKEFNAQQELIAYVVTQEKVTDAALFEQEIKKYLQSFLVDYMIPKFIISLDELPLNLNGKIDKQLLPLPSIVKRVLRESPQNKIGTKLRYIWQDVLGIEEFDTHDDFFEIGGYSLKAIELHSKIEQSFSVTVNILDIFKNSTLQKLEEFIEKNTIVNQKNEQTSNLYSKKVPSTKIILFPNLLEVGQKSLINEYISSSLKSFEVYTLDFLESDDIIENYVNIIKQEIAADEYIFIGFSSGGNIAFEVADLMLSRGLNVSNLLLIDSWKILKRDALEAEYTKKMLDGYFGESYAELTETKGSINSYIEFLNSLNQNKRRLVLNIHLVKAQGNESVNSSESLSQDWQSSCNYFQQYDGFGTHYEMFSKMSVMDNLTLIKNIIKQFD